MPFWYKFMQTTFSSLPNITLGYYFRIIFGELPVTSGAVNLFSTTLTQTRRVSEIVASVVPVTLSDVYNMLPQITTNFLTVVNDFDNIPQLVYIYVSDDIMIATSPPSPMCPDWQDGVNVYSSAQITNIL